MLNIMKSANAKNIADDTQSKEGLIMKQKITVIILSFTLAMFLVSGGFGAWKDSLQIGVSLTTAAAIEEAKDAISNNPTPVTPKPAEATEEPSEEPEEPAAETEKPSAEPEEPSAEPEEPSAETEEPSAETEKPSAETERPSAETEKPGPGAEAEAASGNDGSVIGGVSE